MTNSQNDFFDFSQQNHYPHPFDVPDPIRSINPDPYELQGSDMVKDTFIVDWQMYEEN